MRHPPRKNPEPGEEYERPVRRNCGTMPVHERLLRAVPGYIENRVRSENNARLFVATRGLQARAGVTVIPVVVHIVHDPARPEQNISEEQIKSQIAVLNEDYRAKNPDLSKAPAAFQPLAADAQVEFELATEDPDGNHTQGIIRVPSTSGPFSDDDAVKSSATGGSDPWPASKYLNIWVCQLSKMMLGYAQFPGGPPKTDGVVILHSAFGTTGTASAPFNLGRTTTHEVGHWLNLRHIWGDDGNGCNGSDFIDDTPNQGGPNYGVPSFPKVSCNNGPNGDLFMDYMDYVDDETMFMFTEGQVARIQACLANERASLGQVKDDTGTLKFLDDNQPTLGQFDYGTMGFLDQPGPGVPESGQPTLAWYDVATFPGYDYLKLPIYDKMPESDWGKPPAYDMHVPFGGPMMPTQYRGGLTPYGSAMMPFAGPTAPFGPAASQAVPFVLATPHHSMAWKSSFPAMVQHTSATYEARLKQLEEALKQFSAAASQGIRLSPQQAQQASALYREYSALLEEYRSLHERT